MRRIAAGEDDAGSRQRVQMGCRDLAAPIEADVTPPQIIGQDDDDVGLGGSRVRILKEGQAGQGNDQPGKSLED